MEEEKENGKYFAENYQIPEAACVVKVVENYDILLNVVGVVFSLLYVCVKTT